MAGMRRFALMFSAATASFAFHLGQHAVRNVVILEVSRTAYEGAGCVRARVVPMVSKHRRAVCLLFSAIIMFGKKVVLQ